MDLWQMIANDQANATDLCRAIIGAIGPGLGSRQQLFDELQDHLDRHMTAEEDTVYAALEELEPTRRLISELRREHAAIKAGLQRLATDGCMDDRDWTQRFEDFSYLLDQHFYRVQHELFPAARRALSAEDERRLRRAFARQILAALRAARRGGWTTGRIILGALAGGAAVALAAAVLRSRFGRGGGKEREMVQAGRTARQGGRSTMRPQSRSDDRRLHAL